MAADAIISANFATFLQTIARNPIEHQDLTTSFLATILDRFIQEHPPNFDQQSKQDLKLAIQYRFGDQDMAQPTDILAALYLMRSLGENNPLTLYIQRIGPSFSADEDTCRSHLRTIMANIRLDEEQVAAALIYTSISQSVRFSPSIIVNSLRQEVGPNFSWPKVIASFDQPGLRITPQQFLVLYEALRPLAGEEIDIQQMWGGAWQNTETQLSFISAFASLTPEQLDATTIPGLVPSFTLAEYSASDAEVRERAAFAVTHPLVSVAALTAVFHVALHEPNASDTTEAKRLFQEVVVPALDIFLVSAFGVPKPWPDLATDTMNNLFDRFLYKLDSNWDFVLESLWRKDKTWVAARLVEAHAKAPMELKTIVEHALRHSWLDELVSMRNGFGLDLAAVAHARGVLDLEMVCEVGRGYNVQRGCGLG